MRSGELKNSLKQEERAESGSDFARVYVKYWEMVILAIFPLSHHALVHAKPCAALHTYCLDYIMIQLYYYIFCIFQDLLLSIQPCQPHGAGNRARYV